MQVNSSGERIWDSVTDIPLEDLELEPDEALVMTGRFPGCRFANVVLWNSFMQSYDYANRQISLNRNQVTYEDDGSFRIVVAHEDPGVPNWINTVGHSQGTMCFRWIRAESHPQPRTRVVKRSEVASLPRSSGA